jgi:hypothetical protein
VPEPLRPLGFADRPGTQLRPSRFWVVALASDLWATAILRLSIEALWGRWARSRSPRVGVVVLRNLVVTVLAAGVVAAEWSPGVVTAVVKEAVPVPSLRRPPT